MRDVTVCVLLLRVYEIKSNAKRDLILTKYYNNICINKGGSVNVTPGIFVVPAAFHERLPTPLSDQKQKKRIEIE